MRRMNFNCEKCGQEKEQSLMLCCNSCIKKRADDDSMGKGLFEALKEIMLKHREKK